MRTRPLDVFADPDALGDPAHRLTDADILRLEGATGATVPPRLRELFARAGGAFVAAYCRGASGGLRDVDNLFLLRRDGCVVWLAHDGLEGDVGEVAAASLDEWISSLVVEDESETSGPHGST